MATTLRLATTSKPRVAKLKITPANSRTFGQGLAAVSAGFLPLASFIIAHQEVASRPYLWCLVAAGLAFSAPTLSEWAQRWCKSVWKAWGFTILLEGVMIFSSTTYLSIGGLAILMSINCYSAWALAGKKNRV